MSWFSKVVGEVKQDITEVEAWIKGVNWSEVIQYYEEFVKGLQDGVEPILEALFPGTTSTISQVVNPLLTQATTAITALTGAAQAYQAGTLSTSVLTQTAQVVQAAVVAANAVVGHAISATTAQTSATSRTTAVAQS